MAPFLRLDAEVEVEPPIALTQGVLLVSERIAAWNLGKLKRKTMIFDVMSLA